MITELEPVIWLGGSVRSSSRMSWSEPLSCGDLSPPFLVTFEICAVRRPSRAWRRPSWNSERSRSSISPEPTFAAGNFEVGKSQLGIASKSAPSSQLVDVYHSKSPRSAVQERANLARLSLGFELLGAHPQDAGGFFQCIKLGHGRAPRGRDRPYLSRSESTLMERRPRPATSTVSGLLR